MTQHQQDARILPCPGLFAKLLYYEGKCSAACGELTKLWIHSESKEPLLPTFIHLVYSREPVPTLGTTGMAVYLCCHVGWWEMIGTLFSLYPAISPSLCFIVLRKMMCLFFLWKEQYDPMCFQNINSFLVPTLLGQAFGVVQWSEPWEMIQRLCQKCLCDLKPPFGSPYRLLGKKNPR